MNRKFILRKSGFTLIEILITLSILAFLISLTLTYTRSGNQVLALTQERMRLIGVINRAKSLTFQSYFEPGWPPVCGYGVHFNAVNNSYFIYRDIPIPDSGDCATADNKFTLNSDPGFNEQLAGGNDQVFQLSPGLRFQSAFNVGDIYFEPPDPLIKIFEINGNAINSATITIETTGAAPSSLTITVNKAGQISGE